MLLKRVQMFLHNSLKSWHCLGNQALTDASVCDGLDCVTLLHA